MSQKPTRPTKKQHELLKYIERFIAEHGYGPSYREIMRGCNYTSVATVAVHVNNLVSRGLLNKNGRSARSLEITGSKPAAASKDNVSPSDEKWLINKIEKLFLEAEAGKPSSKQVDNLYVLVGALHILGYQAAANSFKPRLSALKNN